jgi:hypothetical protein
LKVLWCTGASTPFLVPTQVCYLQPLSSATSQGVVFFNQLYQREEEVVVKQVTKEDDDARVGCTAHKLEIFSDLLY